MGEAGILDEDERIELIEGEIAEMTPIGRALRGRAGAQRGPSKHLDDLHFVLTRRGTAFDTVFSLHILKSARAFQGQIRKGAMAMGGTIRARVHRGAFEPLDPITLPEGAKVTISILDLAFDQDVDAFQRSDGSLKGTIDAEALIRGIRESRRVSTRPKPRL